MSSEWIEVAASQFCCSVRDGTHATPKPVEHGKPLVTSKHIVGRRLDLSSAYRISQKDFDEINKRSKVAQWDVLISMIGTVGEPCLVKDAPDFAIKNIGLFKSKGELEGKWLYYYLCSRDTQQLIRESSRGTTQAYIPLGALRDLPVSAPADKEEMGAVTETLGALDDRIDNLRQTNATLEAIAQALFKSWFVDFDGVPPEDMQESELGLIPKGWRVGSVYDIADVRYGAPFASSKFNTKGDGLPLVRIRDLRDERPGVFTPEVHPKGYLIQSGDIIVGMDGEFRAYLWGGEPAWMNQRICAFHPKPPHCAAFVHNAIAPHLARVEATEVATTVIHLGKGDIDEFRVVTPSDETAAKFEALCQPLYDKIVTSKQQAATLANLRDALLPRLISGRLRLPFSQCELAT